MYRYRVSTAQSPEPPLLPTSNTTHLLHNTPDHEHGAIASNHSHMTASPILVTSTPRNKRRRLQASVRVDVLNLIATLSVLITSTASVALVHPASASTSHQTPPFLRPSGGLINAGNTCYLNAQLECAYHIPRVRGMIINPTTDTRSPALASLGYVFAAMQKAAENGMDGFAQATPTTVLCRTLGIPVWEQQDSSEFWKLLLPEFKLPQLVDLYQGSYEGYIAALDGSGRERKREEQFLDLSLDVSSGSVAASLEDMFCRPELLSEKEGNGWRPEKGADKVDALKGSLLKANGLPPILQLHLMRFQYDWQTDTMSKINDRFRFPKVLDLSNICSGIEKDEVARVVYDLQSIVVHVGDYGSGHYYAYVRPNVRQNTWYRFEDDKVTEVSYKEVAADAYGGQSRRIAAQEAESNKGILARLFGFGDGDKFGWGGRTSSAYVLQYVRRESIPMLFESK